jgi:uracil-DNA glycosylase/fructose-specific phosphotransferase system component IIB
VAKALGVGVVASGDPVLTENPFQSAWITAKDLGEFVQRSSIDGIQTAQINSIEQLAWSGHVYNLQTESNWYIAEGVIAHNCYPGTDEKTGALAEIKTDYIDACRPYVRNVIREFQPTRILAFGTQAIHSLFNRAPGIMAVRRGFSWLLNHHDNRHDCPTWYVNVEGGEQVPWGCRCEPIPVLFLMHPAAACRNRFIKKEWMEDLKWALTTPDDFFRERYIFLRQGRVEEIETVSHTMLALSELEGTCQQFGKPIVIDVETRGKQFNKDFRIISLAMCIAGENHAYVWTAQALRDPDIVRHLVSTFDDENNIWVEQSDYDSQVTLFNNKISEIGASLAERLLPQLNALAPTVVKVVGSFGDLLSWAAQNPFRAIVSALGVSIMKAGIESVLRSGIETALKGAFSPGAAGSLSGVGAGGASGKSTPGLAGVGATPSAPGGAMGKALATAGAALAITATAVTIAEVGMLAIDKVFKTKEDAQAKAMELEIDAANKNAADKAAVRQAMVSPEEQRNQIKELWKQGRFAEAERVADDMASGKTAVSKDLYDRIAARKQDLDSRIASADEGILRKDDPFYAGYNQDGPMSSIARAIMPALSGSLSYITGGEKGTSFDAQAAREAQAGNKEALAAEQKRTNEILAGIKAAVEKGNLGMPAAPTAGTTAIAP